MVHRKAPQKHGAAVSQQNNENWVTLQLFSFPHEARPSCAILESHGIPAFVTDNSTGNQYTFLYGAVQGVRLQVRQSDLLRAISLVQPVAAGEIDDSKGKRWGRCTSCGSAHLDLHLGRWHRCIAWIPASLLRPRHFYKCRRCGRQMVTPIPG